MGTYGPPSSSLSLIDSAFIRVALVSGMGESLKSQLRQNRKTEKKGGMRREGAPQHRIWLVFLFYSYLFIYLFNLID